MASIASLNDLIPDLYTQDINKKLELLTHVPLDQYLDQTAIINSDDVRRFIDGLVPWLQSNNSKVSFNGLGILVCFVDKLQEHFKPYVRKVLPAIVERLGDTKDEVREVAQIITLKLMNHVHTPKYVFENMQHSLNHPNFRVRQEFMLTLQKYSRQNGAQSLFLVKIVPSIVPLLCDLTPLVRDQAANTLVEIYRHVGEKVRADIAKIRTIPTAKLQALLARFDEVLPSTTSPRDDVTKCFSRSSSCNTPQDSGCGSSRAASPPGSMKNASGIDFNAVQTALANQLYSQGARPKERSSASLHLQNSKRTMTESAVQITRKRDQALEDLQNIKRTMTESAVQITTERDQAVEDLQNIKRTMAESALQITRERDQALEDLQNIKRTMTESAVRLKSLEAENKRLCEEIQTMRESQHQMRQIVGENEKTISELISDMTESAVQITRERDQALKELQNVERRYEGQILDAATDNQASKQQQVEFVDVSADESTEDEEIELKREVARIKTANWHAKQKAKKEKARLRTENWRLAKKAETAAAAAAAETEHQLN